VKTRELATVAVLTAMGTAAPQLKVFMQAAHAGLRLGDSLMSQGAGEATGGFWGDMWSKLPSRKGWFIANEMAFARPVQRGETRRIGGSGKDNTHTSARA
jgi:hypothetical protein